MSQLTTNWKTRFDTPLPWLILLGGLSAVLHICQVWILDDSSLLGTSILSWVAIAVLLNDRLPQLSFESGPIASFIGGGILTLSVLVGLAAGDGRFLFVAPFALALGLGLLASGFTAFQQYWRELLVLATIGIPQIILPAIVDMRILTAQFTFFILRNLGFEAVREGIYINFVNGSVEVNEGCSGLDVISQLLGLSLIYVFMFERRTSSLWINSTIAVIIAFLVNGVRAVLLSIFFQAGNMDAFHFWHDGDGSLIFSAIAVLFFCGYCYWLENHSDLTPVGEGVDANSDVGADNGGPWGYQSSGAYDYSDDGMTYDALADSEYDDDQYDDDQYDGADDEWLDDAETAPNNPENNEGDDIPTTGRINTGDQEQAR